MTEGEFPFRSFTMRSEGYDRDEVDTYAAELRGEIVELRRALETSTASTADEGDVRLHDPEGAVTRTLAIAQETADRVLHDAQIEADRLRGEADEHAKGVMADADERSARLLSEMEAQAAEVREQGVAAARSAIQVERDTAMAELARVRRVRDDLRTEAVDLKAALDRYRNQAREASEMLSAASSGPLMSLDLPDFIDDDVVLAGIVSPTSAETGAAEDAPSTDAEDAPASGSDDIVFADDAPATSDVSHLRSVDAEPAIDSEVVLLADVDDDGRADDDASDDDAPDAKDEPAIAEVVSIDGDTTVEAADDSYIDSDAGSGTFLAEVRAAAEDDDVSLAPENDDSDRFLSELRGIAADNDGELDSDAADVFFDD